MGYVQSDDLPDLSKAAVTDDLPDLSKSALLTPRNKTRVPQIIDDELSKLGWGDNARLAMLGNVGRENNWNPNIIFGGHSDPANQAFNRGIISWQKDRQSKLANFVQQNGGDFSPTEHNLRLQTQFLNQEMRDSPEWSKIHRHMTNPDLSEAQAYPLLQKYIKYQPQYEANNKTWAAKAQKLGLAKLPDLSSAHVGDLPNLSSATVSDNLPDIPSNALVPELPATLDAQRQASHDPQSTRAGVLYTPGEALPQIDDNAEMDIPIPGGQTLRVNKQKFIDYNAQTGTTVADLQNGADFTPLIGGKAQPTPGIGSTAPIAVHTTNAQGTELNSSGVSDPTQVPVQAALDKLAFPNQGIQTSVVPSDEVTAKRMLDQMRQNEPIPTTDTSQVSNLTPQPQPQIPLQTVSGATPAQTPVVQGKAAVPQQPDTSGVSVSVNPQDFNVVNEQGQPTQPVVPQPIASQPREFGKSTDDLNRVAGEFTPAQAKDAKDAMAQAVTAIGGQYGITPQQAQEYVNSPHVSLPGDYQPGDKIQVPFSTIAAIKGEEPTKADIRTEQAQATSNLLTPKEMHVGENWATQDAEWLNSNAGKALWVVNPLLATLPADAKNEIASSLVGGAAGGASRTWEALAGIARPIDAAIGTDFASQFREIASSGKILESQTGKDDLTSTIFKAVGGAPSDLSRLYLLSRLPTGAIAGMAVDQGIQSAGRGDPLSHVAVETGKGAVLGGIFAVAPFAGKGIGKLTESTIAREAATVTTILGGTTGFEMLTGAKPLQALHVGIVNSLFHLSSALGSSIVGKTVHGTDAEGNEATIRVNQDETLEKVPDDAKANIQLYFDKDAQIQNKKLLDEVNAQIAERKANVTVPTTEAEPESQQYSSVLDEIRQKNLTTKAQIQAEFPQLSREEAADYRRQAWGAETPTDVVKPVKNVQPEPAPATKGAELSDQRSAAPENPVEKAASVAVESKATEPNRTVTTERGTKANIEPKVIDASDIVTSLDKGYPAELQPRDRSRAASKAQISDIANRLDPEQLADSPKASDGRPLVVPMEIDGKQKYVVVSGNGRTEAIRSAYEAGNEPSKAYAEFTQGKAKNDFQRPVYVGELKNVKDLPAFAAEANESNVARMSATEQAQADAKHLNRDLLADFVPSDDGSIHSAANREFVRQFLDKAVPKTEHGSLVDENGQLSQEGVSRVRNAVFAKAYGEKAVHRLAESTDDNVKRVTSALLKLAPKFVDLKEHVDKGTRHPGLDIAPDVAAALEKYSVLRNEGTPVQTFVNQGELFGSEMSPLQKRILTTFDTYKYSAKAISDILNNYVELAHGLGDPNQNHLFGEPKEFNAPTLFREAVQSYEKGRTATTAQTGLFEAPKGREVQPETSPSPETQNRSGSSNPKTPAAESRPAEAAKAADVAERRANGAKPEDTTTELRTSAEEAQGVSGKVDREAAYKAAKDLLLTKLGKDPTTFGSGLPHLDAETLKALGTIANYHIENGITKIGELAKKVADELGIAVEKLRPHLEEMYPAMAKHEKASTTEESGEFFPEGKPSKIGVSIKTKAIEKGLANSFDRSAEYDDKTVEDQKAKVAALVGDIDKTYSIIRGETPLPRDINPSMFIRGAELLADQLPKDESANLHYELMNSDVVRQTSEAAQTLRFAQEREPDSVQKALQDIKKARQNAFKSVLKGRDINTAIKEEAAKLAPTLAEAKNGAKRAASTVKTWKTFIASLEC